MADKLSPEQQGELKTRAEEEVTALVKSSGSDALTIEDKISNVGARDQKNVSSGISLLQEKMGNVFYSEGKADVAESLTKDMGELQGVLAKINPKDIEKEAKYRIVKLIPFFGNYIVNVLRVSSQRRLTLQAFVDHLGESLQSGEMMLRQDNAQLTVVYRDIEGKQDIIATDAFFAESLMDSLQEAIDAEEDTKKKASFQKLLFKVATRAQDLRAMENVHEQFFVSIEMTRDNNDMLVATVQRMLTMGMNVVYIAFAIHAALARQKSVIEAEKGARDFLGSMILSNATAINSHVAEIGDLYKEPVVAMDKLGEAVEQLKMAVDATNKLKAEGIDRARENISKLKVMTEEIRDKAGELPDTGVKSLEASEVLMLGKGVA